MHCGALFCCLVNLMEREAGFPGVALWMPPGVPHISADQEREFGFDRLPEIFGATAFAPFQASY